jgi:tetratricopeptide (TPR) repeat protein
MRPLREIRHYMNSYHVKSGVYHFYRKEFGRAVSFLRKALADESTLSEGDRPTAQRYLALSLKGLGQKLASEGDVEGGIEQLRGAAAVATTYPDIHFEMGVLFERIDRTDEAIDAYRRAIAGQSNYLEAHVALGSCLLDADRAEEAAETLRRAVEIKLDQVRRPFGRGLDALERGQIDTAREWFHEALRAVPQLSREYMNEAVEWIRAEEYERAVGSLDRALALNPKYPDLHNYRGIALCELERYDEATIAFRHSAELGGDHVAPRLNLAFTLMRAGRVEDGETELEAILLRHPDEPVARAKLEELRSARVGDRRGSGARS